MKNRSLLKNKNRIVVKVGTSTLTFSNGRLNFQRIERMVQILSALQQQGKKMVLVSSGSIAAGAGRIGLQSKPNKLAEKQALAALGQAELIKIYRKFFEEYNQVVAQVLLTRDVVDISNRYTNARNTLLSLMDMNIIPIINENDTISTDEIEFGDNDTLSAYVATIIDADLLIMMSDINGLYSGDPREDKDAKIIPTVHAITPEIEHLAKGKGSNFSTGGMVTKINAAKLCYEKKIDTAIINGSNPEHIISFLDGENIGTHFVANPI